MYKHIEKVILFKGLSPNDISQLLKGREYFTRTFYKNNYIAYRNDETEYVMIILKGKVQSMISNEQGKVKKIVVLPRFSTIAPAFLFGKNNRFPVDVKSVEESVILYISKQALLDIIQENAMVLNNYLNIISNKAQVLSEKIWKGFAQDTIRKKLLDYLHQMFDKESNTITFSQSLEELSKYFDVSRPSLSRVLNEFVKNQDIEKIGRGKYQLKNPQLFYPVCSDD